MGAPGLDVIEWGRERARAGPWRGNGDIAYLAPWPDAPAPSAAFVRHCMDDLLARGYTRVVTGALSAAESHGFLAAGFEISERLYLLTHDLRHVPSPGARVNPLGLHRARPKDELDVLELDHRAFPTFWRLDANGLREAVGATPHSRFRLAGAPGTVAAYAICGRAGRRGYLQRLAVDPNRRRHGLGTALVIDGLRWLRRWRCERAVVNTQLDNAPALTLYERLGFRRQPLGLSVLSTGLSD